MSNVSGTISVDVQFTDSTTSSGVQSLKTVTLRDATEYTSGKVAVVTGTCGTTQVYIATTSMPFRDSAGQQVSFSLVRRFAFSATGTMAMCSDANGPVLHSTGGRVAVSDTINPEDGFYVQVANTAGTASYTLVIYGD